MSNETSKANAATAAAASAPLAPEPHDQDLVVVRVIFKAGVSSGGVAHVQNCRPYKYGDTFTIKRALAMKQPHALEIIATARFHNAPEYVRSNDPTIPAAPLQIEM